MNYQDLIAKALEGRTVYQLSKQWGIGQPRLHRYMKGETLPDYETAWKIAEAAGVPPGDAFKVLVEEQRIHTSKQFKLQMGFVQPTMVALLATVALTTNLYIM